MRERVLEAIYKKLEETPNDYHLKKQILLLNKANISTIHSFCLEVIKNNFYEADISPNFRIGDSAEIELLKQDALEELFEELYENSDTNFLNLLDVYTTYKGDEPLKEIILRIYKYIQSCPFPEEWLNEKTEMFNLENLSIDFAKTKWGKFLIELIKNNIKEAISLLQSAKKKLDRNFELEKFSAVINDDIEVLRFFERDNITWNDMYYYINEIKFKTWPIDKKNVCEDKDNAKELREKAKKIYNSIREKVLTCSSEQANEDVSKMYKTLKQLEELIIKFSCKYKEKKKEKNVIDFNDIEHYALKILVNKNENNEYLPTKVAEMYKEKFTETAIDEYQDSNLVQEYILSTVSNGNNMFMVGDDKQSIYKFRQAMPELFLSKYKEYKLKDKKQAEDNLKIQLFKNFRSRKNILDVTNLIFMGIMSQNLGDIDYNEEEFLYLGANYEEKENIKFLEKSELNILKTDVEQTEEDEESNDEPIENSVLEAKFVTNKINELIQGKYFVFDKKLGYRQIKYKDIVILLRATSILAPIFEKELTNAGIPVFSDISTEYLETIEVQTIMNLLKVIDNPKDDIPLVCVLRSSIGNFTDNDLISIRVKNKKCSFYEALLIYNDIADTDKNLKEKINIFLEKLNIWQNAQEYLPLDELIWKIYDESGYYNYVSLMNNGEIRSANLRMLFERAKAYESASFKGLFNFINYIDKLKDKNGDFSSAKIIGENENVVRIMSIHKSKGLEFPVVILSGTGKQFNMQDTTQNILLHQEFGFGPEFIDSNLKIQYSTLAKETLKELIKKESVSEEMRVLYVALTRAREQLIITGISKKDIVVDNRLELEQLDSLEKLPVFLLRKAKSYLDWIQLVCELYKTQAKEVITVKEHNIKNLASEKKEETKANKNIEELTNIKLDMEKIKNINDLLMWKYPYEIETKLPTKMSVTEYIGKKVENEIPLPKFLEESEKIESNKIGTLVHLMLQKLDFTKNYTIEMLQELINNCVKNKIITQRESEVIPINKIYNFTESELYKRIQKSRKIFKEQPFYINLNTNENTPEKTLIQGIIDLYFEDENGRIVLIDYKTDKVKTEAELIGRHTKQLEIYKKAIKNAINKQVDEVYIYSTYFDKHIEI